MIIPNASKFGCSLNDRSCLCSADDVWTGIKTCVLQICGIDTELDAINAWEKEFCASQSIQSSSQSRSSSGLSSNAKIGLAAGIPCGLLAIAAGVGLYFFRKHKARKKSNLLRHPDIPEMDTPEMKSNDNLRRYEMGGSEVQLQELETNANRVELSETTAVNHRS